MSSHLIKLPVELKYIVVSHVSYKICSLRIST